MKNLKLFISFFSLLTLFSFGCSTSTAQQTNSGSSEFEIAPQEYVDITKKAMAHIENFEFPQWYTMLSDDFEFYLPDGDEGTRTSIIGKKANMEFWNSYQEKSGNTKMIVTNPVYLPVVAKKELNYTKLSGVIVLAYFSNEFHYGNEKANVRMNWGFHFNADKKIDKIYTYYDRTPIIEAAKRNFLSKENN